MSIRADRQRVAMRTTEYRTGRTCSHCGGAQLGSASVTHDGVRHDLCHPDTQLDGDRLVGELDCYRLVTVYQHPQVDCSNCSIWRTWRDNA